MNKRALSLLLLFGPNFILITGIGATFPNTEESFLPFLFAAYAFTWLAFFSYTFFLHRKQRDLYTEIKHLQSLVPNSHLKKDPDKD